MSPQELAKAADLWVTTRVSKKAQGGAPQGVVRVVPRIKREGTKIEGSSHQGPNLTSLKGTTLALEKMGSQIGNSGPSPLPVMSANALGI